ncbi:hypothetical protein HXX76_013690 [Chlamydomonas incerta]|uniref:Uncharacterized protein n=1 Tax=Chlamydomonas incerta TaxID=51695 RepID=A0A835SRT8_CHLIN|nr:hypothetical protein HXX76_013690 [Chlamydomonas incerta]|eukprot:KAG2425480.1 hypothetical protein HXX76_013690 [Chlamydomonas incerta]
MQRSGFFHKLRAAAVLAARPAASCGAEGILRKLQAELPAAVLLAARPAAACGAGASRIRTFSSRGDDGRHGDSRGDGLDSSSPVTSAGTKEQPWADPFRGGGLRHDSGGGGGGESQQLLSQAAVTAAQGVEQHGRHWRHSWVTDDSAGLQEEPRVDPFRGGGLSHDSGGGGEGQQLLSQSAATAAAAQAAEQQHRPQLSAAGDTASLQEILEMVKAIRAEGEATRAEVKATRAEVKATRAEGEATRAEVKATRAEVKATRAEGEATRAEVKSISQRLESISDGVGALMEHTAAKQLQQSLGNDRQVHPNVPLTGTKSTADCLLRDANASTKETAASALVQRLQGLPGLRAVLRYFLTRACADLKGLLQRSTYAAASAASTAATAAADASAATVAAAAADAAATAARDVATIQGHLGKLQALQGQLLDATAGTAVEARLAAAGVAALSGAQRYINPRRPRRPRAGHMPESSASDSGSSSTSGGGSGSGTGAGSTDDEHGDGQDSSGGWRGDDDGGDGTKACTPYAAAMMMLDAVRDAKTDELLLLMSEGPVSMLVLSALQPAATLPLTAALNTSSGSSSDGINSSGGSFKPATRLEVDALAVRLKGATLLVVIQEAKLKSNLATARKQVARIGTLFAYAYNVAVAAGAFGEGKPPRLRLEAQIVFARLKGLPPAQRNQMVELVPAEGERHMMRVRVTGLAGCTFDP